MPRQHAHRSDLEDLRSLATSDLVYCWSMQPISQLRFNALAGYARHPQTAVYADELGWFEHANERVLGVLIRDRTDGDYGGVVLARDELLQYRWTTMSRWEPGQRRAKARLRQALEQASMAPDEEHHQGHERVVPVDFFTPVVASERLDPDFRVLVEQEGFSPARDIIEPMMRWYEDVDGNFVEQFQTTAFDARLWELYLFASLVELGFLIDRTQPAPDFVASSLRGQIAIEAVTVNPTKDRAGNVVPPPPLATDEERLVFLRNYMPIKFGSALFSKLGKEYWAKEHVRGMPFALAVQDFSSRGSMVFTRSALQVYLYGYEHDWGGEKLDVLSSRPVASRPTLGGRRRFRRGSSSFQAPKTSAQFCSVTAARSRNSIAWDCSPGSAPARVQMIREGFAYEPDPDAAAPRPFRHVVGDPGYEEAWIEGLDVYHNPCAVLPLDPRLLPGAAHVRLRDDGQIVAVTPDWHPLGSRTLIGTPQP